MQIRKRNILLLICLIASVLPQARGAVRYHSEEDKKKINEMLLASSEGKTLGERVLLAARQMEHIPIGKAADNDTIGTIMIRLDSIDRIGFLNIALAVGQTAELQNPSLKEFEEHMEKVSRRKGKDEGFTSQFFYGADWIGDNIYRGNVKEMTEYVESGNYKTKTLDRVSRNRNDYPAMADSAVFDKIKIMEMGFKSHRIPHLKKQSAGNKQIIENLQDGDIIMMLSPDLDYDLYDVGFIGMINGVPHLVHPSNQTGEVSADSYPLQRLFKLEGQYFYGFRWLRPTE